MRRFLTILLTALLLLSCTACQLDEKESLAGKPMDNPAVLIEQIGWKIEELEIDGDMYVVCRFRNNSEHTITSFKMSFVHYPELTQDEFEEFYGALQAAQGFTDEYMAEYIKDRDSKGLPISMYAQDNSTVAPGEIVRNISCYYLGGFTTRNLMFSHLFVPESATYAYEKDGETVHITYSFQTGNYVYAETQGD